MQYNLHSPNYWPPPQPETAIAGVEQEGVKPLLPFLPAFRKRKSLSLGMVDTPGISETLPWPGLLPARLAAGNLRHQDSLEFKYHSMVCPVSSPVKPENPD